MKTLGFIPRVFVVKKTELECQAHGVFGDH